MAKFLVAIMLFSFMTICSYASPDRDVEVTDGGSESNEFWPPDIVPHPIPPGDGPTGPGKPELA